MMKNQLDLSASRRPPASPLPPSDADENAVAVLAFIRGDESYRPANELEAMRARVAKLQDPTSPASLVELTRQLPTLEALWHRFAMASVSEAKPDRAATYLRMALAAQQAYARTFTLVRGLALQQQGHAQVALNDDSSKA